MTTIKAHFDGKAIIPDEPVQFPVNSPLTVHVEDRSSTLPTNREKFEKLNALEELAKLADDRGESVDWSRDSIYPGTLDDPR